MAKLYSSRTSLRSVQHAAGLESNSKTRRSETHDHGNSDCAGRDQNKYLEAGDPGDNRQQGQEGRCAVGFRRVVTLKFEGSAL